MFHLCRRKSSLLLFNKVLTRIRFPKRLVVKPCVIMEILLHDLCTKKNYLWREVTWVQKLCRSPREQTYPVCFAGGHPPHVILSRRNSYFKGMWVVKMIWISRKIFGNTSNNTQKNEILCCLFSESWQMFCACEWLDKVPLRFCCATALPLNFPSAVRVSLYTSI